MCLGNQSKSMRYGNSNGDEIGVKFNRHGEVIIVIESSRGACKSFTFGSDDDQTLNYFENILTNLISYYNTFDVNYGRKVNGSKKGMAYKVIGLDGCSLEVGTNSEIGIRFEIQGIDATCVNFIFLPEDKPILEMFKTDLANVIKRNISKLPPVNMNSATPSKN